jgi:hypothetical protein
MNATFGLARSPLTSLMQASNPPADAPIPTAHIPEPVSALALICGAGGAGSARGRLAVFDRRMGILGPFSRAPGFGFAAQSDGSTGYNH